MRRTGPEEIGSSKALGRTNHFRGPRVLPLVYFLVKLPSGGLGSLERDDTGRSLPGFIFAFAFLPRGLTHRLCYRASFVCTSKATRGPFTITGQCVAQCVVEGAKPPLVVLPLQKALAENRLADLF